MGSKVKELTCTLLVTLTIVFTANALAQDWETTKQELDAICEEAREARLTIYRAMYIEECVEKKEKENRSACERFYADWGAWSGVRPPLYYDIQECERAFEHRQSQRSRKK